MAQLYCTGAVDLWVGVGNDTQDAPLIDTSTAGQVNLATRRRFQGQTDPVFLGHCERGPVIDIMDKWRTLKSDQAGDHADDVAWMGEEALIFCNVNRFSEFAYSKIAARPVYYQRRGATWRRDVGALMLRNRLTYKLWLRFPYARKPAMRGGLAVSGVDSELLGAGPSPTVLTTFSLTARGDPMPAGYRFFNAYLIGPDKLDPLGTRARMVRLVFHAVRDFRTKPPLFVQPPPPPPPVPPREEEHPSMVIPAFEAQPQNANVPPLAPDPPRPRPSELPSRDVDGTGPGSVASPPRILQTQTAGPSRGFLPLYDHDMGELPATLPLPELGRIL